MPNRSPADLLDEECQNAHAILLPAERSGPACDPGWFCTDRAYQFSERRFVKRKIKTRRERWKPGRLRNASLQAFKFELNLRATTLAYSLPACQIGCRRNCS